MEGETHTTMSATGTQLTRRMRVHYISLAVPESNFNKTFFFSSAVSGRLLQHIICVYIKVLHRIQIKLKLISSPQRVHVGDKAA